jgi:hypothetical protein
LSSRTREGDYKTQQHPNTALEAACRIIKPGELENLTLDKTAGWAACSKPAHK